MSMQYARIVDGVIAELRTMEPPPPHKAHLWRSVVYEGSGSVEQMVIEPDRVRILRSEPPLTSGDVNGERDRRLRQFVFGGRAYDFCDGRGSDINIAGAGTLALAAIIAGAQPGDLRWADPSADFTWVAADNTLTTMDAQTCLLFAQAAASWKARHIRGARAIKDMSPIPADYGDDARWPS